MLRRRTAGRWELTRQTLRAARRSLAIWSGAFAGLTVKRDEPNKENHRQMG